MEWSLEDLLNLDGRSNTSRSLEFGEINELINPDNKFLKKWDENNRDLYMKRQQFNIHKPKRCLKALFH